MLRILEVKKGGLFFSYHNTARTISNACISKGTGGLSFAVLGIVATLPSLQRCSCPVLSADISDVRVNRWLMKMIPVHKLAKEYETDVRNIINWAKSGKITASRIGTVWMIDEPSLKHYISTHTKKVKQNQYLKEQIQEKEEEITDMIAHLDDFLFSLRSLNYISPLFRIIINEMSLLLPEEKMQEAFISISTGESIYEAAKKYGVSYDRMCYLYRKFLRMIVAKSGFLKEQRNRLAALEYKVRELSLLNEKREMKILQLTKKDISEEQLHELYGEFGDVSSTVLDLYSMSLVNDVEIETRAANVLKANDIETVEQLYKYVAMFGFKKLLDFDNMGTTTLRRLKYALRKKGLLDNKDKSPLIDFFRK